jgi:signal transduction histidine kinase
VIATTEPAPVPVSTPAGRFASPPAAAVSAALAAVVLATVGFALATGDGVRAADAVRLALLVAWAAGGAAATRDTAGRPLGLLVLAGTIACAVRGIAAGLLERGDAIAAAEVVEAFTAALVVAIAVHFVVALPHGRLFTTPDRIVTGLVYAAAAATAVHRWLASPAPPVWPLAVLGVAGGLLALPLSHRRYSRTRDISRQRMQWVGLAAALVVETAIIVLALRLFVGWPGHPREIVAASLLLVAGALVAGSSPRIVGQVERLLQHAVSLAGISALVVATYIVVVVVGLGRVPTDAERGVLVLSMLAAAVAALLFVPTRRRLTETANRLVYGEASDPTQALETFGQRLTRALPMEELLLQLAELLVKHLDLRSAEVWSGTQGVLERVASVPDRGPGRLELDDRELPVVARAGVSGRAWVAVWLPQLLASRGDGPVRVVPMTNQGELFGLIVVERAELDDELTDEDERVLTELARQVGLAVKNSSLDLALQASLDEVRRANVELQESRARIVATADAERRKIERDLHDGAQQHLVALAVKLRLVQRLAASDLDAALVMLEEARTDVQATVDELRSLAHGIYPPLLMDKGLPEALRAAAGRAVLPVRVEADGVTRYPQEVEAAVYFCCLEALQNAAKHAGSGATVTVTVQHGDGELRFEVADDGAGFLVDRGAGGQGFVNMADRLGAIGGTVEVRSAPGQGTRVAGRIPVEPLAAAPSGGS